jgi:hypothetical protein
MDRAHGRLKSICGASGIGGAALFYSFFDEIKQSKLDGLDVEEPVSLWLPNGHKAAWNEKFDEKLLTNLSALFEAAPTRFFDTPRY